MKAPMPLIIERVLNNSRVILARQPLITGRLHRLLLVHFLIVCPPPLKALSPQPGTLTEKHASVFPWRRG